MPLLGTDSRTGRLFGSYNVLFKSPSGKQSHAQIEAFEDTWHWTANDGAELAFDEVMRSGNAQAANMLRSIRSFLGENDMMAYLTMMAVRLIELHRVLKPTGSLYLHCDPTASHYLKILLDAVFEKTQYRAETGSQLTATQNLPRKCLRPRKLSRRLLQACRGRDWPALSFK
jgi:site-specific DNA-methyltransferase (adenine-specific)